MGRGVIFLVGIGPGVGELLPPYALNVLLGSDYIIGYKKYIEQVSTILGSRYRGKLVPYPMGKERERAKNACDLASRGFRVSVVSSGDTGIYGMAPLVFSYAYENNVDVEIVPGIPALCFAASRAGVPIGGDFFLISLSDLITPWRVISYNIDRAASTSSTIVFVNPGSSKRKTHLARAFKVVARYRPYETPVVFVENAYTQHENILIGRLGEFKDIEYSNMNSIIFVGSNFTRILGNKVVTDRGYGISDWSFYEINITADDAADIENLSLKFIDDHIDPLDFSVTELEVVKRVVHALSDFSVSYFCEFGFGFVEKALWALREGKRVIVDTDMAKSALILKLKAHGLDCEVVAIPKDVKVDGYTRLAWGIRSIKHLLDGSFVVIGNAPSALIELGRIIKEHSVKPSVVIATPVGYVEAAESKRRLKKYNIPYFTILGNRGGTPAAVSAFGALLKLLEGVPQH